MLIRNKFFAAFLMFALSIIPIISASDIANAATSGSMPASFSANNSGYRLLSESGTTPSVSGFTGNIQVVVTTTNGASKITTTAGLTAPTGYSSADWTTGAASLGFEGSQSAINSAIATLSFRGTTVGVEAKVRVSANLAGAAYNPTNGHSYEVVDHGSTIAWAAARTAATARTFNGQSGYLATITSAEEQAFLYSKTPTTGWIGASDNVTEQTWKWADGPEAGQTFWTTSCATGLRGICVATGMYSSWRDTQPTGTNGLFEDEDYGQFESSFSGNWNDLLNGGNVYLVEYGGGGGAAAETYDATTSIAVAGTPSAPTGLNITPGDSQLTLSFNAVTGASLNGGTLVRYEYQQDSGSWTSLGTLTTATITGLVNNTSYTFAVRTITSAGTTFTSAASGLVSGTPVVSAPVVENSPTPTPTPTRTMESSPEPTPTPTQEPSSEPTPAPTQEAEAQAVELDARGLEVINPLTDAPLAVAETTVTAIALASGAAAAAGAAAAGGGRSQASTSRGGAGSGGRGSSSSSNSGDDSEGGDDASIEGIDFEMEGIETESLARGDKLKIWSIAAITALDKPSHNATIKISPISPLLAKLISDSAYLKAMLGTIAALLPALGVVLGLVGTIQAGGLVLPPSATVLMAIAVLGIFDALAGFIAVTIFSIGITLTAGINTAGDVRMLMGLFIIGFGPALLADAFRSLRRPAAQHHHHWWERVVDLAVAPLMGGWAAQGMVGSLPALAGVKLPIADHANAIALAVAIAMLVRVLLEELVAQGFRGRLNFIHPTEVASPSILQQVIALTMRSLIFCFVASAFVGTTWHLYVGTLIFAVPSFLGLMQDLLPNYPKLYQLLPAGMPGLAFALLISAGALVVLVSVFGETPDLAQVGFVLLPIPSAILGVLGMFGREAAPDDVRWYQRESLTWLYRIGGIVIFVVTLQLAEII